MKFCDSSVVIASFASWHESHDQARVVIPGCELIGHVASETYSVLTRLPAPHRFDPSVVAQLLHRQFAQPWYTLSASEHAGLIARLPAIGVTGGAVYDAVIAATASAAGGTLLSFDLRAARTYERVGARTTLLASA